MWADLDLEIAVEFARYEGHVEPADFRRGGFARDRSLTLLRATRREYLTEAQRIDRRRARQRAYERTEKRRAAQSSAARRAYKTAKQREYDARKRAERRKS